MTDGVNVVYLDTLNNLIVRFSGGVVVLGTVASYAGYGGSPAHAFYEVEFGWTAYLLSDGGGVAQVWVRSPTGEIRKATSVGQSARIVSLGNAGQVVYSSGGQVYVTQYPYTAAPVRVFADLTSRNDVRWRGEDLRFYLGRTAFDVSY